MSKTNPVIAVACSDLHLSENAPVARSVESDWFAAMQRPLDEVRALQRKYECPILFAGDLFDKWNPHPVLINFALDSLPPEMYCIPGNHDAPFHNLDLIGQSAYWTMVAADKILDQPTRHRRRFKNFNLWAFPFGIDVAELGEFHSETPSVAVIHAYMHFGGVTAHKDAPESGHVKKFNLRGYDAVFVGDNHFPWSILGQKRPNIMNCGTMMRRRADEIDYKPGCGLLRADGTIDRYEFDCSADKFIDGADKLSAAETATGLDLSGFADELKELAAAGLDFRDALIRRCGNNVSNDVKKIILKAAGL